MDGRIEIRTERDDASADYRSPGAEAVVIERRPFRVGKTVPSDASSMAFVFSGVALMVGGLGAAAAWGPHLSDDGLVAMSIAATLFLVVYLWVGVGVLARRATRRRVAAERADELVRVRIADGVLETDLRGDSFSGAVPLDRVAGARVDERPGRRACVRVRLDDGGEPVVLEGLSNGDAERVVEVIERAKARG